ncbi:MAG: histidine-type phosphatase [Paludibacteraceae bacterium]|nr:histidine-type phosphatase [Paludibacteraceae bacterium]
MNKSSYLFQKPATWWWAFCFLLTLTGCKTDYAVKPYAKSVKTEYTLYNADAHRYPVLPADVTPVYEVVIIRHGARYLDGQGSYSAMKALLDEANEQGTLTPKGIAFRNWYDQFYPLVKGHEGQLTNKGRQQHRDVAASVYQWVPALFGDSMRVRTSTSQRVIDSQEAFVGQLAKLNPNLRFSVDTTETLRVHNVWTLPDPCSGQYFQYLNNRIDQDAVISQWFAQPELTAKYFGDKYNFIRVLRNLIVDLNNLDFEVPAGHETIMTRQNFEAVHDIQSTFTQLLLGRSEISGDYGLRWYQEALLDIIQNAEQDITNNDIHAGLYFTHDILIDNFLALMQAGPFGKSITPMEKIASKYPLSAVPMACNIQLLICKDRQSDELIVYPLLNGRPIALNRIRAVRKYAYKLSDLKNNILQ